MDSLDPVLVKAIKFLISASKSSKDQLRNMLDDAMTQRRTQLKLPPVVIGKSSSKQSVKPREPSSASSKTKTKELPAPPAPVETKEADLDSETTDIEENDKDEKEVLESTTIIDEKRVEASTSSDPFDLETMADFGDISCVVCKNIDFKPGNQLVECQECHSLYHQECHKPLLTSSEISDPRNIWYCAKCTKNMKKSSNKMAKNSSSSSSKGSSSESPATTSSAFQAAIKMGKESAMHLVKAKQQLEQSSGSSVSGSTSTSGGNGSSTFTSVPFKRTNLDGSKSTSNSASSSGSSSSNATSTNSTGTSSTSGATAPSGSTTPTNKPVGLAGLAAISKSFGSSTSSKSADSSSSSTSASPASTSSAAVDKKLQMLKRKAKSASEPRSKKPK